MKTRKILDTIRFDWAANLAVRSYLPTGRNQQPHILRVVATGRDLAGRSFFGYTEEVEAALCLHDVAKAHLKEQEFLRFGEDHAAASAVMAEGLLRGTGRFTDKAIQRICAAIADHHHTDDEPVNRLAAVLRVCDAGIPSLGFYLRKSVRFCLKKGMSLEAAIDNAVGRCKEGRPYLGEDGRFVPKLYQVAFSAEIDACRKACEALTAEKAIDTIAAYEASADAEPEDA